MDYSDAVLIFEADGARVFDLIEYGVIGCRPDFSADGKRIVWGETDWALMTADINLTGLEPKVTNVRKIIGCDKSSKIYHVDMSPDGKYIAFTFGPDGGSQQMGSSAEGWNIYISDLNGRWTQVTTDGRHNKEPDWVPIISKP
jgi:Tol biopolymer transport system component